MNSDDVETLRARIAALERANANLSQEVDLGDMDIGKKTKEINKLNTELQTSKAAYESSLATINGLKSELAAAGSSKDPTLAQLQEENAKQKATIDELQQQIEQAAKDAKAAKTDQKVGSEAVKANKKLTEANISLQGQLDEAVIEKSEVQKKNEELLKQIEDLKSKNKRFSESSKKTDERNSQLRDENDQMRSALRLSQSVLANIQDKASNTFSEVERQVPARSIQDSPKGGGKSPGQHYHRDYPTRGRRSRSEERASEESRAPERRSSNSERVTTPASERASRRSRSPRTAQSAPPIPPESITARRNTSLQQRSVPPSFRTALRNNRPGHQGKGETYSPIHDPARRPPFTYQSHAKPEKGEVGSESFQQAKSANKGFAHFIWRVEYKSGPRSCTVGTWVKGLPSFADYQNRKSGLYPFLEADIRDYGDGGWFQGSLPGSTYRQTGPRSQDLRKESHGVLFCFRQPFNHQSSTKQEKNDWMIERRENRHGYAIHGQADQVSISSVSDNEDQGEMSPRMLDSLIARYDETRIETLARDTIGDLKEFRTPKDANGRPVQFDIDRLRRNVSV